MPSGHIQECGHQFFISSRCGIITGDGWNRMLRNKTIGTAHKCAFFSHHQLISEQYTYFISWVGCSFKIFEIDIFRITKLSSYDKGFLYLTRRYFDGFSVILGRIPDFEAFWFFTERIKFIEIYLAIDRKDFLFAYIGIFEDAKRKSSNCIRSYRRDIDKCCHQKPAGLDKDSSNQCFFDDIYRSFFIFGHKEIFDDGKEHHKSQCEVGEVLHHIPKLPEWSIKMKDWSIDERIVQSDSCDYQ